MNRLFLAAAALILLVFATGPQTKADAIYTLNYDGCGTGCGNGNGTSNNSFGFVTLHQLSSSQVAVTLQITDPSFIVNTGSGANHAPFAFNTDTAITISGISDQYNAQSTFFTVGATNATVSGLGSFGYEISCTSNCPAGASGGGSNLPGNLLSFTATATSGTLNLNDFIANSGGYYFASDILGPGGTGTTGEVAANLKTTITNTNNLSSPSNVPEPGSLALLGGGLAALGSARFLRGSLKLHR
jgi:hypothetical protein